MLPQIVFYALQPIQTCQTGQCSTIKDYLIVDTATAKTVTKAESVIPFATNAKTTIQYKRNLFGRLVPVQTTVITQAKKDK